MGASSDVEYPLAPGGGARDGRERYDAGQNSFEQLSRHHQGDSELDLPWDNRPGGLGGRSISGEERVAATALLDCVKQRPLSRASDAPSADGGGGGRVDSGVWPMIHLLGTGGEADFHQVQVCGRKEAPGGADGVDLPLRNASAGSSGGNSARTTEEERRIEEELLGSMPKQAPFGGFRSASGSGSRSSTRSASKKAIFLASRDGLSSEKMWRKGDSSSLSRLFASSFRRSSSSTSSSGSGGSGGGGPGAGVGGTTPHCGGGGGSIKYSGGGGGASWEHNLGPLATTGGASRTHDDIVNRNGAAAPAHPLRQQSFGPDGEIGDLSLLRDDRIPPYNAPQTGSPGYRHTPATGVTAAGLVFGDNGGSFGETPAGVRNWENAAAAARFTASRPASEPSSIVYNRGGISTFGGNAPVPPGPRMFPGGQTTPSNHHNSHHSSHLNTATAGPIAPPPTPRVAVLQAAAPVPPAPAHHEKKSSFNLLASMIPDISKLGGPSSAPALQTSTTWPGATAGLAAHGGSPMVTIDGNPIQAGGLWTRQVKFCGAPGATRSQQRKIRYKKSLVSRLI